MRSDKETIGEINHVVRPSLSILQAFITQVLREVPLETLNKPLGRDGKNSLFSLAEMSQDRIKAISELLDQTF